MYSTNFLIYFLIIVVIVVIIVVVDVCVCVCVCVVFQAVCLESLTAQELLLKLLEKLGGQSVGRVSSFVRLTSSGLLVMVDDTMVHSIQDEACFLVQTVKGVPH